MRPTLPALALFAAATVLAGCRQPEFNPTPTTSEEQSLIEPIQLTKGFKKAGEAYFAPDMKWIIFQAAAKDVNDDYLMYVAQLKWEGEDGVPVLSKEPGAKLPTIGGPRIVGIHTPIPISPSPSWNSCGYFSPDGNSLIFGSTALNPKPREETEGYQRNKGTYRWTMPATSEIFRADGWKGAVSALPPGEGTNLAKYPITKNDVHEAECSYSPDGKWIIFTSMVDDLPLIPPPEPTGEMIHGKEGKPADAAPAKPLPNYELFVMRPDGSQRTRLTKVAGYDGGPFFSPDGKRICYRSDRVGNNFLHVHTADLLFDAKGDITGIANETTLTSGLTVNWGPYWHPDGKHLIYATSLHGHANYELYLMRDDGSHKTRITHAAGADLLPVFSPDGRWLMWTSSRGPEQVPDSRNPGKTKNASEVWIARFKMPPGT